MEKNTFDLLVICWIILACIIFSALLFVTAPYGRYSNRKWGLTIPNRLGWIFMEIPVLLIFIFYYVTGSAEKTLASNIIVILFSAHYVNRSLVYPFRIKTGGKRMPVLIVVSAVFFNIVNGSTNGYFIGTLQSQYTGTWLSDIRFIAGILIFLAGMLINMAADEKLIRLRKTGSKGYQIPSGGLYNKISCPNFFGEIIEWAGFALLCWSLPALAFFLWTVANLVPRALDHHKWYRKQFSDYPAERKAVLPYLL
jgi:3-oxo-5-alpha-steroid 4-dehydrogenase 1